jgi:hypothetical protein
MAIFNSYVKLPEGILTFCCHFSFCIPSPAGFLIRSPRPGQSGREAAANLGAIVASPAWQICFWPPRTINPWGWWILPKTGRLRGTKSMRFIKHPKYPNNVQISDSQVGFLVRENMESTVTQPSVLLSATALTVNSAPWHIVWHWHVQLQTAETWLTSNYIQPTKHKILYLAIIAVILETSPNRWVFQPFEGSMFHFCYFMGNKQMTVAAFHFTCVFWDFANQVWPPNSWHINCNITTMHLLCSQNWVREGEM